jgi:hypothetical protein
VDLLLFCKNRDRDPTSELGDRRIFLRGLRRIVGESFLEEDQLSVLLDEDVRSELRRPAFRIFRVVISMASCILSHLRLR